MKIMKMTDTAVRHVGDHAHSAFHGHQLSTKSLVSLPAPSNRFRDFFPRIRFAELHSDFGHSKRLLLRITCDNCEHCGAAEGEVRPHTASKSVKEHTHSKRFRESSSFCLCRRRRGCVERRKGEVETVHHKIANGERRERQTMA